MDIVEVREGEMIEPPLSIDEKLRLHCEWQEKDHTNGDYFHLLAKEAAATITALRARVAELEGALEPFAVFADDNADAHGWAGLGCQKERIVDWFGPSDFHSARAALRAKGGE